MTAVKHLVDEEGFRLPGNMSQQFRDVQGGLEYLKQSADDVNLSLKSVHTKLNKNTTDLSVITERLNDLSKSVDLTNKRIEKLSKLTTSLGDLLISFLEQIPKQETAASENGTHKSAKKAIAKKAPIKKNKKK